MSRYNDTQKIIRWCKSHRGKDFYYYDVDIPSRAIGALCDTPFRGKIWVVKKGKSVTRDSNNGLIMYGISSWVDLDNV